MGGGVNPLEWLLPPVAITHAIVDTAASAGGAPIPGAPGSASDREAQAAKDRQQQLEQQLEQQTAAQQAEAERLANVARPQTASQELAARQRASVATELLGGGRRRKASQTLTEPGGTLSGSYV